MPNTTFADVICNHAMVEISDIRLQNELAESPARFLRKMSFYVINAVPRFNRPPEAREWLKFTAPSYDDMEYIVPTDYDGGTLLIPTECTGYSMASVIKIQDDGFGALETIRVDEAEYNPDSGNITIAEGYVASGDHLSIDFYTDGVFDRELGYDMKEILGMLVQYVWEFRFANDFLIQQPKIKDRNFDVGNEANYMRASTERMRMLQERNNQRLKAFEQNMEYRNRVLDSNQGTTVYSPENA